MGRFRMNDGAGPDKWNEIRAAAAAGIAFSGRERYNA